MATANKSILVVEDIDATIDLQEKLYSRGAAHSNESHDEESKVGIYFSPFYYQCETFLAANKQLHVFVLYLLLL